MIRVHGATKRYDETVVVDGVDLELPAGGVTAIIGPNGAGKSTLLSMISRLIGLDAGTVTIDGLDVTKTPGDVLAKRLSILRQDNTMTARLTVGDLVAFGRYPHSRGRLTGEDARHIEQALDYMDLTALRDRFLDELSGGQRQRAFVAMVLCQDTDYVLLDEPLNNLDIRHAVSMMRMIRRAAGELNKTVVVVLHDINFASCHADRIVAMRNGRIFQQGTPEHIISAPLLEDLYGTAFRVSVVDGRRIANYYL
ncbi:MULTISPECIES: iron ABC transporter ATP-binding protein [Rhizobium/Agrobacterium group]|jgi:iron complex transport system ATP-binding protein|uniref:iron ABC transporter ATP-binding protein n=1 Tax=Rhizobium/Agrobacterium group TaxID=227290 RepID=UPI0007141A4A|nr:MULTISPECIES: ABC transporter ATP-binding protein [Rhizobium/Agrobacterium group]KQY42694.1 iron ABC transporter ATP-binding protein [Rhizobium sp. Root483D2]